MGKKEITLYTCDRCGRKWEELPGRPMCLKNKNGYYMVDITFTATEDAIFAGIVPKMRTSAYWCVSCGEKLMAMLDDEGYLWDIEKGGKDDEETQVFE